MPARFPVALVGVGKIARDQHIPAIAADPDFELVAAVSRNAAIRACRASPISTPSSPRVRPQRWRSAFRRRRAPPWR